MQKTKLVRNVTVLSLIAPFLILAQYALADGSKTRVLVCAPDATIGGEIKHLGPGDTLLVEGVCNENVSITEDIHNVVIDGQGAAIINGTDASRNAVTIRGNGITLRGFNITGGNNGILVSRGGSAVIAGNVIEYVGNHGINVNQNSSVRVINNMIQNNPGDGILVNDNSSARIGFLSTTDGAASPNIVQNNGGRAINVNRSSNARVVGNVLSGNGSDGVLVNRVSHADVSSNAIDGNGGSGVLIARNSGVNLGSDSGAGIFDAPNSTTANNSVNGVRCNINSYMDGRLGTLNGNSGPVNFHVSCVNSL